MVRYLLPLALLALLACSSDDDDDDPAQACRDTADAVAKAAQRCGQDYQTNYDAFVQTAAGGDCGKVTKIRDEGALRSICIPSFATKSCEDLLDGKIDSSCQGQLQRPAS